jgi:hypothetical protein
MPETPDELYARAAGDLRVPPLEQWDTWPFEGEVTPKALQPPSPEPVLTGAGGVECPACGKPDTDYVWTTERWRLRAFEPGGLPLMLLLEPRLHVAGPAGLPDDLAAEQGVLLGRIERAILSIGGIGKVHIGRWGEGAEHLHWWFIARPEGFGQLRSSFAEIWSDVLPPTPEDVWRENVAQAVAAL